MRNFTDIICTDIFSWFSLIFFFFFYKKLTLFTTAGLSVANFRATANEWVLWERDTVVKSVLQFVDAIVKI